MDNLDAKIDELTQEYPPHDDVKDALACAIEIAIIPTSAGLKTHANRNNVIYNTRFGGVSARYG